MRTTAYLLSALLLLSVATAPLQAKPDKPPAQERATWFQHLGWPERYETRFRKTGLQAEHTGLTFFALSSEWMLLEIQTDLAAYQPVQIYMLYHKDRREGYLLSLPWISEGQIYTQIEVAGLSEFNSARQELSLYSKARGAGGCGVYASWRFEETEVYLVSLREQTCEQADAAAEMILDPSRFPLIWPPQPK